MTDEDNQQLKDIISTGAKKASGELIVSTLTPAAEEIGKGLVTVAKCVNICLTPLSATVWGYNQIQSYIETSITKKLRNVETNKIVSPAPNIAGPAIEALRFVSQQEHLKEMFASLLATAMNSEVQSNAHPAYVEIIKQLSADEAKVLRHIYIEGLYPDILDVSYEMRDDYHDQGIDLIRHKFQQFCKPLALENQNHCGAYFDNLLRLRVLELNLGVSPKLENRLYDDYSGPEYTLRQKNRVTVVITHFGEQFLESCVEKT